MGVSVPVVLVAGGFAAATGLVLWLFRDRLREWRRKPVIPTNGSEVGKAFLTGVAVAVSIVVAALSLNAYKAERQARVAADIRSLSDRIALNKAQILTAGEVQKIARRLSKPTLKEFISLLGQFNEQCSMSPRCRRLYTESVTKVLRVTNGRIVPAPTGTPPARRRPQRARPSPPPAVPPPKVVAAPDPRVDRLARDLAELRRALTDLQSRKQDSAVSNGLDNRLADVERAVQAITGRVDAVQALLDGLCRVLRPGRCG